MPEGANPKAAGETSERRTAFTDVCAWRDARDAAASPASPSVDSLEPRGTFQAAPSMQSGQTGAADAEVSPMHDSASFRRPKSLPPLAPDSGDAPTRPAGRPDAPWQKSMPRMDVSLATGDDTLMCAGAGPAHSKRNGCADAGTNGASVDAHGGTGDASHTPSHQPRGSESQGGHVHFRAILGRRHWRKKATVLTGGDNGDGAAGGGAAWPCPDTYEATSLCCLTLGNPLRRLCIFCIEARWSPTDTWADSIVTLLILLNTVQLMMFDPLDTKENLSKSETASGKSWPPLGREALSTVGLVFTVCFLVECLIKVIALGLVRGRKTYLQDKSNWLDFFVVAISVVDFAGDDVDLGALSSLRLLRILRVLRAVTRFRSLNQYVMLLLRSIPMMASTMVTLALILLIFGILGVQLFQGALQGRCFDINTGALDGEDICGVGFIDSPIEEFWIRKGMQMNPGGLLRCQWGKSVCLALGENPGRGAIHFDNILNGVITIFQIMTLEGWADLCYQLQDSTGFWSAIYFLFLVVLGPYFAVQLFLVVLSINFNELYEPDTPAETSAPQNFVHRIKEKVKDQKDKLLNTVKPPPPSGLQRLRARLRNLAKDESFNNMVLFFIVLNTVSMATEGVCSFDTDSWCVNFKITVEMFNVLFTFVFLLEAVVKLVGLGPSEYFKARMNIFDFVIVCASMGELGSTFGALACYMAPLQDSWETEKVRLGTEVPDKFMSSETIAALTIPRAIKVQDELVVNPMAYYTCGSGGFMSVMRAFRLVRLIKFLRGFPEIHKQVKILLDVIKSVAPLFVLISILLLIFTVLGMNLFGAKLTAEWDEELLTKGAQVFVTIPLDLNGGLPRHGKIQVVDFENRPHAPFKVQLDYGEAFPVVNESVGRVLDELGMLWAAAEGSASTGTPVITGITPRFHFDNLAQAFVTCFQVMTMANWNDDFYDVYAGAGMASIIYFTLLIVVGNWMLINLFVAILLQEFFLQKEQADKENMDEIIRIVVEELGKLSVEELHDACDDVFVLMDNNSSGGVDIYELEEGLEAHWHVNFSADLLQGQFKKYDSDGSGFISAEEFRHLVQDILDAHTLQEETPFSQHAASLLHVDKDEPEQLLRQDAEEAEEASVHANDMACWCLSPTNGLRVAAKAIVQNRVFEDTIFACILVSTTALAISNSFIGEHSTMYQILYYTDLVINAVFTIELFLKVIAMGMQTYWKSKWNRLDVVIVVTSDLEMILSFIVPGGVSFLKLFRVFRALRPLRIAAAKMPGLSILVRTAELSFPPLCNTMVLVTAAALLLGLFMMQLMAGQMNHCTDPEVWTKPQCVGLDGDGVQREWLRYYVNFDNLGQALFAQLILATQDDWPAHMLIGTDITGAHTGPANDQSLYLSLFYMVSVVAMAFVVINMVVGVFVDNYQAVLKEREKEKEERSGPDKPALTEKDMPDLFDDPPAGSLRAALLLIVRNKKFDLLIAFFISSNVLAMTIESYKRHSWQSNFDDVSNTFFALVFGAECIIKMTALRTRRYLDDNYNKFDFFLVMVTFLGYVMDALDRFISISPNTLRMLRMLRILRILRALRLIRSLEGLQKVMQTLALSSSACANLVSMLMLVFFMFSVVLVNWFGTLCVAGDEAQPGKLGVTCLFTPEDSLLDPHAHFQGVGIAIYTLFRIATGDDWGSVMESATLQAPRDQAWSFSLRPREPIRDDAWNMYEDLLGESKKSQETVLAREIAVQALTKWYELVEGREDEEGWPTPGGDGEEYVQLARLVLPNCLTDDEAKYLQDKGVANCSVPGNYHSSGPLTCATTCGDLPIVVYTAFYLFFAVAAFVLFQLVIGVLIDIYIKVGDEKDNPPPCPGCQHLTVKVLKRIQRRWVLNARAKAGAEVPAVMARAASQKRLRVNGSSNRVAPAPPTIKAAAHAPPISEVTERVVEQPGPAKAGPPENADMATGVQGRQSSGATPEPQPPHADEPDSTASATG